MTGQQDRRIIVGIDIGGTGTRLVATDGHAEVLARSTVPTPATFRDIGIDPIAFMAELIREVARGGPLAAVGIGASGPIDAAGVIRNEDTVPGFTGVDLVGGLRSALQVPVVIDNDAVTAAVAEQVAGAGRGHRSLLAITLGTGIGAAVVVDGAPVRGGDGQHPEAGHISVSGTTAACYCGRTSCWEQAASRRALQARAAAAFGQEATSTSALSTLVERATDRDPVAVEIFDWYGSRVADGLSTLLAVHRPQVVVFGGSAGLLLPYYGSSLRRVLERYGDWISSPLIVPAALDDHGGAIGAAILAARVADMPA